LRWWNHDVLGFVVFSCAFSFVLGLLSGGLFVAVLKVGVDVLGDFVYLLLQWR